MPAHRSALERAFASRTALMPFATGGFPSLSDTARLLPALAAAGADAIEVGIPFSDPIADGPVIAQSMNHALRAGATPTAIFDVVRSVRAATGAALLAMVSFSIISRMGEAAFVAQAADAGFDGLIVPDIDLDEAPGLSQCCRERSLMFTLLVAPTSPPARIERIAGLSSGFLYVLARVGITGERGAVPAELPGRIAQMRGITDLPLAVGFGIADAEQVRAVLDVADAAIVGSAIVRRIADATARGGDAVDAAASFVRELAAAKGPREQPAMPAARSRT